MAPGESALAHRSLAWRASSTADQIAAALRDLILQGDLAPGTPIDETQYARGFGTSRNSMREAIRALARAGLVQPARRRPAVVTRLTEQDVRDIFGVRRVLELEAVRMAIANEQADFSGVDRALDELVLLGAGKDWHRLVDADSSLHAAIVAAADSPRLGRLYESVRAEIRLGLSLTDRWDADPSSQVHRHREIVERLKARDERSCIDLLRRHVEDSRERVLAVLARSE